LIHPKDWKPNLEKQKQIEEMLKDPKTLANVNKAREYVKRSKANKADTIPTKGHKSDDSTIVDNEEPLSRGAFASSGRHVSANIASVDATTEYQLHNCYLLDSGADEHVCNDRSRSLTFTPAVQGDYLIAGDTTVPI
jgi:hypothetical protein